MHESLLRTDGVTEKATYVVMIVPRIPKHVREGVSVVVCAVYTPNVGTCRPV